jgi:hypothetical protein
VLFTSGFTETAALENGDPSFGAALLSKPYRKSELAERIRQTLDGAGRRSNG